MSKTLARFPLAVFLAAFPCAGLAPAQFELRTLVGGKAFGALGTAVCPAGDVDQDGHDDQAVGSPGQGLHVVEIYSGRDGSLLRTLKKPQGGDNSFGWSVALAGDVDADGMGDLAVGAPDINNGTTGYGAVWVFSGADGSILHTFHAVAPTGDEFGYAVASAGDVDDDGHDDVLVGAPHRSSQEPWAGTVYVYSGRTGELLHEIDGGAYDSLGYSVAAAGDLNGDGHGDFLAGFPQGSNLPGPGGVHVYSGADGALLYSLSGSAVGDFMGATVASAGDLDGDQVPDVATTETGARRLQVFSGVDGSPLFTYQASAAGFGQSLAAVDDQDGDGLPDLVVGNPLADPFSSGEITLHSGADGSVLAVRHGLQFGSHFGYSVAPAGDADADGSGDFLVGARHYDAPGLTFAGAAYVFVQSCPGYASYCTPKVTSEGCVPSIFGTGAPSLTGNSFRVKASGVPEGKPGLMFWGYQSSSTPFQGGTKCVLSPVVRTPIQDSGSGGGSCQGSFSFHFNAAYMNQQGIEPGDTLYAQYWFRDPASASTTGLTDGLRFPICP